MVNDTEPEEGKLFSNRKLAAISTVLIILILVVFVVIAQISGLTESEQVDTPEFTQETINQRIAEREASDDIEADSLIAVFYLHGPFENQEEAENGCADEEKIVDFQVFVEPQGTLVDQSFDLSRPGFYEISRSVTSLGSTEEERQQARTCG